MNGNRIEECISEVMFIAASFDIQVNYRFDLDCSGICDIVRDTIYLDAALIHDKSQLFSVFFHEMCHILSKRHKLYESYHCLMLKKRVTKSDFALFKRVWLKAEQHVDDMAELMFTGYFKKLKFSGTYRDKFTLEQFSRDLKSFTWSDFKEYHDYYRKNPLYK